MANANLRIGPGTSYAIVGGVVVEFVDATGEWCQLENGAWIAGFLVDGVSGVAPVSEDTPAAPTTAPVLVRAVEVPFAAGPAGSPAGQDCDPSYPDVCIQPYPPDLDCPEIPYGRFRVLPPDSHGFDGDRDGIRCERD